MWILISGFVLSLAQPQFTLDGDSSTLLFNSTSPYTIFNEEMFSFLDGDGNAVLSVSLEDNSLILDRRMEVHGNMLASASSAFQMRGYEQWKLVVHEDFEGSITGWSDDSVNDCGNEEDLFLGGPCKFSSEPVSKTWDLPAHQIVRISATVHFFDKWEGEHLFVKIDGEYVWTESYVACSNLHASLCLKRGFDVCGDEYPDRLGKHISFVGEHSESSITLEFSSDLTRDSCEVSWGLDDVEIYIK